MKTKYGSDTKVKSFSMTFPFVEEGVHIVEQKAIKWSDEGLICLTLFSGEESYLSLREYLALVNEPNSWLSRSLTLSGLSPLSSDLITNLINEKRNDIVTGAKKTDLTTESSNYQPVFSEKDRPQNLETIIYYWPNALKALAELNRQGNIQHYGNADTIRWKWKVSSNHVGKLLNHLVDNGTVDTDGIRHSTKVAWRALALLETELINAGATPGRYRIDDEPDES